MAKGKPGFGEKENSHWQYRGIHGTELTAILTVQETSQDLEEGGNIHMFRL